MKNYVITFEDRYTIEERVVRVSALNEEHALRKADRGMFDVLVSIHEDAKRKEYRRNNEETGRSEMTERASIAHEWHKAGSDVIVAYYDAGRCVKTVRVAGAPVYRTRAERMDENTRHCKAIARDVNAHAAGDVRKCPECGETIRRDDWPDVFRCPECGHVDDVDSFEVQTIWDYLEDVYNVEFRVDSSKELRSVQIMVACGGPNIYLDTASKDVELYWWTESARWPLSYDAVQALDDWAEEYWGCL